MQPLPRKSSLYPCLFILALTSTHADALNLLVNGDFATGFSGWTFTQSSPFDIVFWTSAAGTPPHQNGTSGGSLNLTAMPNSSITASQCVAITGNSINASVLVFPFVTAGPSAVQVVAFASGDCGGDALVAIPLTPAGADMAWIRYEAAASPLAQGTGSVRFELTVSDDANQSTGDYLFDDAQLDAPTIFVDGFESGSGSGN
jgi:hypothetical protein